MWQRLWTPELGKSDTCVGVLDVDALPSWAASSPAPLLTGFALTATGAARSRSPRRRPERCCPTSGRRTPGSCARSCASPPPVPTWSTCSTAPGATIAQASAELGIGRATIYREMAQYGIKADQLRGW